MVSVLPLTRSRRRTKKNKKWGFRLNASTATVVVGVLFLSIFVLVGMFLTTASIHADAPTQRTENVNVKILTDNESRPAHISPAMVRKNRIKGHEDVHGHQGETGVHRHHVDIDEHELRPKRPDWSPLGGGRFPEYKDGTNVFVRPASPDVVEKHDAVARTRREAVKNAMKHAWGGYKTYAWGKDELLPLSKTGRDNWGGMGTTLVDSLDTLWLMGMKDEFWEARDWVRDHLHHDHVRKVSVFETTIRSLGGLLSAYDWSGDDIFLEKALDLGTRLAKAFDTETGIPLSKIPLNSHSISSNMRESDANVDGADSLETGKQGDLTKHRDMVNVDGERKLTEPKTNMHYRTNIAEAGSLQVEFRFLAHATGNTDFAVKSQRVFELLRPLQSEFGGLFPYTITSEPTFLGSDISFGSRGDSFYEYMLKIWLQGGKTEPMYREMYDTAMDGLHKQLIHKTGDGGLTYIALTKGNRLQHRMDHLACFMAGLLALGAYTDPLGLGSDRAQRDLRTGKALCYTCYQMYARTKTGLGPEIQDFNNGKFMGNKASGSRKGHLGRHEERREKQNNHRASIIESSKGHHGRHEERTRKPKRNVHSGHEKRKRNIHGGHESKVRFFMANGEMLVDNNNKYILRPEVIESFFVLFQLTGDPVYREWGWEVFQAIEHFCKTDTGYGGVKDVDSIDTDVTDNMESFFLAETLKYSYLLQDPDTEVDILNNHVFNTEAHPMRVFPTFDKEMNTLWLGYRIFLFLLLVQLIRWTGAFWRRK